MEHASRNALVLLGADVAEFSLSLVRGTRYEPQRVEHLLAAGSEFPSALGALKRSR